MSDIKNKVLSIVRMKGPVLPVQISSQVEKDSIYVGAMLSDLVSSKLIKISNARVGGSPVYYVDGQENRLEILYKGLAMREKEAYDLLRKNKVMKDRDLDPAIRVAIKQIKDFAKPIMIRTKDGEELYWRWHLTRKDEVLSMISSKKVESQIKEVKQQVKKEVKPDDFLKNVESSLEKLSIRTFEKETLKRGREINMIVNVPSNIGNLNYFLYARNKKSINDKDLVKALELALDKNLPLLFLSNGKLTKKAETYLEKEGKGLIVFRNV